MRIIRRSRSVVQKSENLRAVRRTVVAHGTLTERLDIVIFETIVLLDTFKRARAVAVAIRQTSGGFAALPIVRALLHFPSAVVQQTPEYSAVIVIRLAILTNASPPAVRAWFHPAVRMAFVLAPFLGLCGVGEHRHDGDDNGDEERARVQSKR